MSIEKSEFEAMDALDEQQIVSELKGHIIDQYFYEFQQGGRQVVGISYSGIKEVARKLSDQGHPISVEELQTVEKNEEWIVTAVAVDLKTKEKRWGASQCSKLMQLKDGSEKPNPFALQTAMSKAQRNAIRNFIPEIAIQEGYKEWKERSVAEKANKAAEGFFKK